jgi:hypothetical protein
LWWELVNKMTIVSINATDDRTFCCCCCVKWNSLSWRRLLLFFLFRLAACLLYENTAPNSEGKEKGHQPHMSSTRASWAIRLLLFSMDFHSLTQSNDLQCITYSLSPPSNYTILGWAGLDSLLVATHTHTHTHIQYIQSINFYIIIYVDLPVRITARFVTYKLTVHIR